MASHLAHHDKHEQVRPTDLALQEQRAADIEAVEEDAQVYAEKDEWGGGLDVECGERRASTVHSVDTILGY